MPEIPEVEAFKAYATRTSLRKKINDVTSSAKTLIKKISFTQFKKALIGKTFIKAERKGKYLILAVSGNKKKLVMHFGLTGSLVYKKKADEKVKYSKVQFIFANGAVLHWINRRKFGRVWLVDDLDTIKALQTLGTDALKITQSQFLDIFHQHPRQNIKALLMDQETIAGIGNEYSDEILFQAGVDPHHKAEDLIDSEIKKLFKKMQSVLKYFITFRKKEITKRGEIEYFSNEDRKKMKSSYLQAHRRIDNICPKNKNHKLKKVTIAGRSAYYCPKDQK